MAAYRVAIASTEGTYVDAHFGSADRFYIYDVDGEGKAQLAEVRAYAEGADGSGAGQPLQGEAAGMGQPCGCGCSGMVPGKIAMISDCRFLLCAAAGPGAIRRLEAAGVMVFDVTLPVQQALEKLTAFYR